MPVLNQKAMALLGREPVDTDRATQSSLMEWATSLLNEGSSLGASLYAYALRWEMEKNQTAHHPEIVWKSGENPWSRGEAGFIGKMKAFCVYRDGSVGFRSRNTGGSLALRCLLPGIKDHLGYFGDMGAAKQKSEKVLAHWLQMMGVSEIGTSEVRPPQAVLGGDVEDSPGA